MGGCSYDRDVYGSSSGWGSSGDYGSSVASDVLSANYLDCSMHPLNRIIESKSKHPIVIMLDVTGSNTDFAKIVYDKMPMFYGQIEQKGYLKDFDISVCAVGDAYCDAYPLQISEFSKGKEIDNWLSKLVLEGCGGGQRCETYELAAYYLLHNFKFAKDAKPIVFFLGDESAYDYVNKDLIQKYVNNIEPLFESISTKTVFKDLIKKMKDNVYMFLNPYNGRAVNTEIKNNWENILPKTDREHLICMENDNEKAIIDLMLGVISLISEGSLDSYKVDMLGRGQTTQRIDGVTKMLSGLSNSLVPVTTVNGLQKSSSTLGVKNKNKRL